MSLNWVISDDDIYSDGVEFAEGVGARFKQKSWWSDLLFLYQFNNDTTDKSGNGNTGTGHNLTYQPGGLDNLAIFNGINAYFSPTLTPFAGLTEFYITIKLTPKANSQQMIWEHTAGGIHWQITINRTGGAPNVISTYVYDGTVNWIDYNFGASFVDVPLEISLCSKANGTTYFWVNGVLAGSDPIGTFKTITPTASNIGTTRGIGVQWLSAEVDRVACWGVQKDTDGTLHNQLFAGGVFAKITKISADAETVTEATSKTDSTMVLFTGFSETKSGTGSTAYKLSNDDGNTYQGYDSGWDPVNGYTSAATINSNIGDFSPVNQQIKRKLQMQSNGYDPLYVSQVSATVQTNTTPTVECGPNLPASGTILDTDTFNPFSGVTVSDPDESPGHIVLLDYDINDSGSYTEIPKGAYANYQEAARALSQAGLSEGIYKYTLRATDNLGATNFDFLYVTITASEDPTIVYDGTLEITDDTESLTVEDDRDTMTIS